MKILVTGATGFLGSSLVRRLCAEQQEVRILARSQERARPLVALGAELVVGDVCDHAACQAALDGVETVYHLAGKLFMPGVPAQEYARIHVEGTRSLLSLCRTSAALTRFVHCSTTGVLGVTGAQPANESAPFQPTNSYEQTKGEAELLVKAAGSQGLPVVIARPGLVYGPGDVHLLGFFKAIQRRLFRPVGRHRVWLHPIYITDMTEALVRCGREPRALGETFHLTGRQPVTIADLARTIAQAEGVPAPHSTIPLRLARLLAAMGDITPAPLQRLMPLTSSRLDFITNSRVYDVSKARTYLDFVSAVDLADGIAQTVAWYRQEGYLPTATSKREVVGSAK